MFQSLTDNTGKLARCRLRLSEFDADVVQRAGAVQQTADALSRLQTSSEDDKLHEGNLLLLDIDAKRSNTSALLIKSNGNKIVPLNEQDEKPIDAPLAVEELIVEQERDGYCKAATLNDAQSGSKFDIEQRELFVPILIVNDSIQIGTPTLLRARNLYPAHRPHMAEHP